MKRSLVLNLVLILAFCASFSFGQIPTPQPVQTPVRSINEAGDVRRNSPEITPKNPREEEDKYLRNTDDDDDDKFRPHSAVELSKIARQRIKITDEEKQIYKPAAKADDLEILKIFSAPSCAENRLVLDASDERCAAAADLLRVSFYSFLREFYGEKISDFRVLEDDLIAGNSRYIHGFLVDMGETQIGKFGKESAEATALINYPIAKTPKEESEQRKSLETGITYQNLNIASKQKLVANHTYLMRIVNYSFKDDWWNLYNKDTVYVLKVGGLNKDRMAIILWKKLSEKKAPRLKDEKID